MSQLIAIITAWVLIMIARFGYLGIFVTMTLESAAIPIPSEIVLPFSGFLISTGQLNFVLIVAVATLANLVGASAIYFIGFFGGRTILEKYGKYVLIQQQEINKMDRWLSKYQSGTAFFTRLVPGVRTFSSLVIGAAEGIRFYKFLFYTFLGSLLWNFVLTYVGFVAGDHWNFLHPYFQKAEVVIGLLLALAVITFIYKHLKRKKG